MVANFEHRLLQTRLPVAAWLALLTCGPALARMIMAGGMSEAKLAAANAAVGNCFSVSDILHARPMNPLLTGAGADANQAARNGGMTLAAMSQYAKSLGMTASDMAALIHKLASSNGQL